MDEKDQRELNQVMARRQSNLALKKEGAAINCSDSGGPTIGTSLPTRPLRNLRPERRPTIGEVIQESTGVLPDRIDDRRGDDWHLGGDHHTTCDEWTINDQRLIVNSKYDVTAATSREGLSLRSTTSIR